MSMNVLLNVAGLLLLLSVGAVAADRNQNPELVTGSIAYFSLQHPKAWAVNQQPGLLEIRGKGGHKGVRVRVYAIGLRSAGGKYRDLRHALDDIVFQVRDEFGGAVTQEQMQTDLTIADDSVRGWHFTGRWPLGKQQHEGRWWCIPHGMEGVVLSIQHSAPQGKLKDSEALVDRIISSITRVDPTAEPAQAEAE
jgi:hypothetical protein